ncbi:hypothetical protein ACIA7S_37305 [Streptomyces sp. NPDC051643]|uniref:hypothetical protein n=1 Tax=Streptomyces sp. NPDC051643 TaxID=3365665 RepID=UPI0037AE877B
MAVTATAPAVGSRAITSRTGAVAVTAVLVFPGAAIAVVDIIQGTAAVGAPEVWKALTGAVDPHDASVVTDSRLPRAAAGLLVGAARLSALAGSSSCAPESTASLARSVDRDADPAGRTTPRNTFPSIWRVWPWPTVAAATSSGTAVSASDSTVVDMSGRGSSSPPPVNSAAARSRRRSK